MSTQRVESATRDLQLSQGLEGRVADPAWFLARQWQAGEFKGDDAANPLVVKMTSVSVRVDNITFPDGTELAVEDVDVPLEPLIEREAVRTGPAQHLVAAELGWMLMRALRRAGAVAEILDQLRKNYPLTLPAGDGKDPVGVRRLRLLVGASFDGTALEAALAGDPLAIDPILSGAGLPQVIVDRLRIVVESWSATVTDTFLEPGGTSAWDNERMEYRFELSTTGPFGDEVHLRADGYPGGRLDWYAYDRFEGASLDRDPLKGTTRHVQVLPAPLSFSGMPSARFWEMEEGSVYFGHIQSAQEDLARVAVATYAVVHGDDWFVVPLNLPLGTVTQIVDLEVLDDFGRTSSLRSTAVVDGGQDDRAFKFFELSGDRSAILRQTPLMFLPPTVETTDAGRPIEDIRFMRDESANLAWAVEQRVESIAGNPIDLGARLAAPPPPPPPDVDDDRWPMTLSTQVPPNWVPLLPVRLVDQGDDPDAVFGSVMFQRGRMPGSSDGETRGARGRVLVPDERLLIHEEEVPREGVRVVRRFQSARDASGRLHTWVGRRKGPGRGIGESGLQFDHLDTS